MLLIALPLLYMIVLIIVGAVASFVAGVACGSVNVHYIYNVLSCFVLHGLFLVSFTFGLSKSSNKRFAIFREPVVGAIPIGTTTLCLSGCLNGFGAASSQAEPHRHL